MFITILFTTELDESDKEFMLRIYKEYYAIVKYTINKIIDEQQSGEDVVQECFVSLIKYSHLLRTLDLYKLNSYIIITAKRKAYDFNKKRQRKMLREQSAMTENDIDILDNISSRSPNIEDIIEWKEQYVMVKAALDKLPEKYRDALLLKYQYQMEDHEIAKHISIKPEGIRMYIKRGREKLMKIVAKEKLYEFE